MFKLFSKFFQQSPNPVTIALEHGGTIVDVRSSQEFSRGSAKGAVNIPHNDIERMRKKFKKMEQPIVVCCASGMRANMAVDTLNRLGYDNVVNGQTWARVSRAQKSLKH